MATASAIPWLRRIASCFFFTLAILFAALWVRSYWYVDSINWATNSTAMETETIHRSVNGKVVTLHSTEEKSLVREFFESGPTRSVLMSRNDHVTANLRRYATPIEFAKYLSSSESGTLGFLCNLKTFPDKSSARRVQFPFWFPVLVSTLLAIAIHPAPRFKFSLRDLFTLTTVAALTIGPLAFWLRSIG